MGLISCCACRIRFSERRFCLSRLKHAFVNKSSAEVFTAFSRCTKIGCPGVWGTVYG